MESLGERDRERDRERDCIIVYAAFSCAERFLLYQPCVFLSLTCGICTLLHALRL